MVRSLGGEIQQKFVKKVLDEDVFGSGCVNAILKLAWNDMVPAEVLLDSFFRKVMEKDLIKAIKMFERHELTRVLKKLATKYGNSVIIL